MKKGKQQTLTSKKVNKSYVDKEDEMIKCLETAKLLSSGLTAEDLSHSNANTDANANDRTKIYCKNLIKIADEILRHTFKLKERDNGVQNIKIIIELCYVTVLGRYLVNIGKEVSIALDNENPKQNKDDSLSQWERHSWVIIYLTVLLAALDHRHKRETKAHGIVLGIKGKNVASYACTTVCIKRVIHIQRPIVPGIVLKSIGLNNYTQDTYFSTRYSAYMT